ncbi:hypothetical protein ACR3FW_002150 [Yersinia enterocolitica]
MKNIDLIAKDINNRANFFKIGGLQKFRKKVKSLYKVPCRNIFSNRSIHEDYAFHLGGRTELQFNIGYEYVEGTTIFRHGVAFSLELSQSLPDIEPLIPKVLKFNEYLRVYSCELSMYKMWHYSGGVRSSNYSVSEIPLELMSPDTFIFIGKLSIEKNPETDDILEDFDRLYSLYCFIEGEDRFPLLNDGDSFVFTPGCTDKLLSTTGDIKVRFVDINLRHNLIQSLLYKALVTKVGEDAVGTECSGAGGTRLDLVVKTSEYLHIYEIKIAESARACIRQALAQLLEYSCWKGAPDAQRLIVVGEPEIDNDTKSYLRLLRKKFSIPIYYAQFKMGSNEVIIVE